MITPAKNQPEAQMAISYLNHFQVALNNWYLWQLEQKKKNRRIKRA
ncbi:MAG: hypothetical protein KIT62_03405 [Cyclobacteriaceae bacterium]|nr:hypothetical protein [Cyclobacteriaceae bacterium]